jgi:RNA polymerase sigma-70 factor (ECF subfamily)
MQQSAKQAFQTVVGPHVDVLYRAAYRLTGRRCDAEDLVQEVCLRAFVSIAELEGLNSPRGWLLKVQYRLFVDSVRRARRTPLQAAADVDAFDSRAPGLEQTAEAMRAHARLSRAWPRLGREQRALLALHAEGYDLEELHGITGLSKGALSARLHRARVRLAKLLDEHEGCASLAQVET